MRKFTRRMQSIRAATIPKDRIDYRMCCNQQLSVDVVAHAGAHEHLIINVRMVRVRVRARKSRVAQSNQDDYAISIA